MILLIALLSFAPLQDQPVGQPKFKVLDLVFTVKDLETTVRSLEVKETDTEIRIELAADVLFDFDKSNILPKAEQTLIQVADVIRERGKGTVRIEGHTDSKGSDAYNQRLSRQRADSVADWLRKQPGLATLPVRCSRIGRYEAGRGEHETGRLGRSGGTAEEPAGGDNHEQDVMLA